MKNNTKQSKKKKNNKNMLNNQSIKTRQTQNLKAKYISNEVMHTQNKKRERKVIESLGTLFLPHPGRTFPLIKPLNRR